jgi:hypothetical protein
VLLLPPPPQEIRKPASEIAIAVSSTIQTRLRRSVNGAPSNTAQNTTAPPLFHGRCGERFAALELAVIVNVVLPVPPLVSVTAGALAVTLAAVPLVELMEVVNETVPA